MNPVAPRYAPAHTLAGPVEADVLALPEDVSTLPNIQNPTTGAMTFMIGISLIGGPDTIA